jgi:hypothetical protein
LEPAPEAPGDRGAPGGDEAVPRGERYQGRLGLWLLLATFFVASVASVFVIARHRRGKLKVLLGGSDNLAVVEAPTSVEAFLLKSPSAGAPQVENYCDWPRMAGPIPVTPETVVELSAVLALEGSYAWGAAVGHKHRPEVMLLMRRGADEVHLVFCECETLFAYDHSKRVGIVMMEDPSFWKLLKWFQSIFGSRSFFPNLNR